MNFDTLYSVYRGLEKDSLTFIYRGTFSDKNTEKIISLSEYNIESSQKFLKIKKRVSFIMAESFQNIIRHDESIGSKYAGMFALRNIDDTFYITSVNTIDDKSAADLELKLKSLNDLNAEQLKEMYLSILSNEEMSDKGGAGLGLIEMARRSGNKLKFDFEKVNEERSLFFLQVKIKGVEEKMSATPFHKESKSLNEHKEIYSGMSAKKVFMIYKGDFSDESISPVLNMIQEKTVSPHGTQTIKKKVFIVLNEIIRNISNHSDEYNGIKDGIFLVGKKSREFFIAAGNIIENKNIESLRIRLNDICDVSKKALKESKTKSKNTNEGLIKITADSNRMDYEFIPVSKTKSFFTIRVNI